MIKKRIKAYCIDLIIHLLIFMPTLIFFKLSLNHKHESGIYSYLLYFFMVSAFGLLLLKDVRKGQSLGKKIARIKIVDMRTNESPSVFKSALRNYINLMFTPVDIIFLLADRSFGDMVVNTTITKINVA